ncbi:MAG: hypothetical protein AB1478_07235 [Nitrospirota bacterium]
MKIEVTKGALDVIPACPPEAGLSGILFQASVGLKGDKRKILDFGVSSVERQARMIKKIKAYNNTKNCPLQPVLF